MFNLLIFTFNLFIYISDADTITRLIAKDQAIDVTFSTFSLMMILSTFTVNVRNLIWFYILLFLFIVQQHDFMYFYFFYSDIATSIFVADRWKVE